MVLKLKKIPTIFPHSKGTKEGLNANSQDEIGFSSISGAQFLPDDKDDVYNRAVAGTLSVNGNSQYHADIQLPHGATITKVVAWGADIGAETWSLIQFELGTAQGASIANNIAFNTEVDVAQGKEWIVNNSLYSYKFATSFINIAANTELRGARIEYKLK